jgi:response regulator RpfG family c-di-GMP phosphodiesterase
MLIDNERNELRIECAIGMDEEIVSNATVKVGEGIAGKVAEQGTTMLVTNIEEDARLNRSNNDLMYRSKSFLSVPISLEGEVVGVVNVASPLDKPVLDDEDARLLEILVSRFSSAISKMRSFAVASARFEQVRETFKAILDTKRYIDGRYFELIKSLTLGTVDKLGLGDEAKTRLNYLINIYDLGLAKVGFHIIKNPKDLSPKDREEIQKHTLLGHEMVASIDENPDLAKTILYHHENYDGSGYPGELRGDAIPIEARILRVSDSLRALVSNRPYQRQYSLDEAQNVLKHRSGTFFDPAVVDAFIEVMNDHSGRGFGPSQQQAAETPDETIDEHS